MEPSYFLVLSREWGDEHRVIMRGSILAIQCVHSPTPLNKSQILTLSLEKAFDTACLNTLAMVIRQSAFSGLRNAMCSYEILFKVMAIKELLSVDGLLAVAAGTSLASSPTFHGSPYAGSGLSAAYLR